MTFVFPVLLGGLLLAGIPVLLHLLMRQKPKMLSFPAFRFLVQRRQTNLRKLRLRHLLLLALRMALIALLCLALGRPRLFNQGLSLNSERPVAAVLVFDTSMSMEYRTSDKLSRLDEAKKRGREFVNELPAGSRVVILDSADAAVSGRGDWLLSMSKASEQIKNLKLRPGSASVLQTLEYAYRIMGELARNKEDETSRYLPRFVCVFSDRTRACWDKSALASAQAAANQVPPSLEGLLQARDNIAPALSLLKELRTQLPPAPGQDYPDQILISALEQLAPRLPILTKEDFPPDSQLSALTETIQRRSRDLLDLLEPKEGTDDKKNSDAFRLKLIKNLQILMRDLSGAQGLFVDVGIDQPVDLAITHLELPLQANGQPRQAFGPDEIIVLRAVVQATGRDVNSTLSCKINQKTYQQSVEAKAGVPQTVRFQIDCKELQLGPGVHQLEARFDPPDLLPFNNSRFVTFAIREPPHVLVLTDNASNAEDFKRALYSLPDGGCTVDVKSPDDLAKNTGFRAYQAVYLFEVPDPRQETWVRLLELVQQGIGLGIIPAGKEMNVQAYSQDTARKVMPGIVEQKVTHGADDGKNPGAVWNFDDDAIYQHPFMLPFREWKRFDIITERRHAFAFWDIKPFKDSTTIIFYKDTKNKYPALLERRLASAKGKAGKILLFTTPLDARTPRWNDYLETKNSTYVVVIGQATKYLTGEADAPRLNFFAGQEEPVLALPAVVKSLDFILRKDPDVLLPITPADKTGILRFRQVEGPGNYSLLEGGEANPKPVAGFSVNVASEESDLTRVPIRDIESLFGADAVIPVDRKADIRSVFSNHWNEPIELFPLFMVALLLILAVENLLANKFYRRDHDDATTGGVPGSANRG